MPEPTVVPPFSGISDAYREWEVRIDCTNYCIVQEDSTWTLLRWTPDEWIEDKESVAEFLYRYNLVLATVVTRME